MPRRTITESDRRRRRYIQNLAESYVEQAGISCPPVDPMHWCRDSKRIRVYPIDLNGECDGLLLFRNGKFHLFYQPHPRRGRFTLAHEVAHYLMDKHHRAIRSGVGEHSCVTGFISSAEMEREADWFAAALLMPSAIFAPRCPDPNFMEVSKVAAAFDVSLTAALLRTVDFTKVRTAVVVTVDGKIKWYSLSDDMAYSGVHGVRIGHPPPRRSKTSWACANLPRLPTEPIRGGRCYASDWFVNAHNDPELWEELLPLPQYRQVVTLLTFYSDC